MSVRYKFNEFKKEIKQAYYTDKDQLLEMSQMSVDELVQAGYFHRRIESFAFYNEFDKKDITSFFNEECTGIDGQTLGAIEVGPPTETIAEFIERLRYHTVKCRLWFELVEFMSRLKEESINRN